MLKYKMRENLKMQLKQNSNQNMKCSIFYHLLYDCMLIKKRMKKKLKKKMKKIFIIENFFISWFANEKICDFFVIENSEIDVISLCLNMNWLFFFHLWQWNSNIFFMIAYEFQISLKAKKWTCISKKRINCFWKSIRNWMKIFLHFIDCEKWNVLKTEKKLKKKQLLIIWLI